MPVPCLPRLKCLSCPIDRPRDEMDFRYSAAQADLKARAAAYTQMLQRYEDVSEQAGGPLPEQVVKELTAEAMRHGVYAINMPVEWGGAGLSLLDQVIVEEEFGRAT